ncbi:MAG: hypothetical protein Nkreftii_002484 [Candidatus Nitrospira kreftii]|uniref:Uncharacterized protein n=1 Tax=Candidatus Nitrospira kreftii TaxID=2652173 RepID=A0A7S8J068_9BACT|nr:MAG: hypothetical protein Nkreftii_002484 [Candidatus Nitrospira kreftii]
MSYKTVEWEHTLLLSSSQRYGFQMVFGYKDGMMQATRSIHQDRGGCRCSA